MSERYPHCTRPCAECPWRTDVAPGRFSAHRFHVLARTAYDMAIPAFGCHKSPFGREFACAGFLLRGAAHNLGVRLAVAGNRLDLTKISDGGHPLFADYRSMAVAQGVPADDPALKACRSNRG